MGYCDVFGKFYFLKDSFGKDVTFSSHRLMLRTCNAPLRDKKVEASERENQKLIRSHTQKHTKKIQQTHKK